MLNDRLQAALKVRDAFLPLKRSSEQIAIEAARCALVMLEERPNVGLALGAAADPVAKVTQGAAMIAAGYATICEAHPELAQLIRDAGLERFYPYGAKWGPDETPPTPSSKQAGEPGHLTLLG